MNTLAFRKEDYYISRPERITSLA